MRVHASFVTRSATPADIPFVAQIEEMASTPPFPESMWMKIVSVTSMQLQKFLMAMYAARASRWGAVEDFIILERDTHPVAACAVYRPDADETDRRSFRMDRLPAVAEALGWSQVQSDAFRAAYDEAWGDANRFLEPIAEVIIESVGVLPEVRGTGAGKALMEAAFERGRALGARDIGLSVINGNEGGRRLYDRVGLRPVVTFHAAMFDDAFPGFAKMRLGLANA